MSLTSYRAAPSRDNVAPHSCSFEVHRKRDTLMFLIRFGDDLLSHVLRRSTISAVALNCRVRDGIGCFAHAMITKPKKQPKTSCSKSAQLVCVCMLFDFASIAITGSNQAYRAISTSQLNVS